MVPATQEQALPRTYAMAASTLETHSTACRSQAAPNRLPTDLSNCTAEVGESPALKSRPISAGVPSPPTMPLFCTLPQSLLPTTYQHDGWGGGVSRHVGAHLQVRSYVYKVYAQQAPLPWFSGISVKADDCPPPTTKHA
jgi:hypothetical protein